MPKSNTGTVSNMSTEQRNLPKLLRAAERRVNAHVFRTGGDDSLASIPANLDRDVDLLLMEAAGELERLSAGLLTIATGGAPWPVGHAAMILAGDEPKHPDVSSTTTEKDDGNKS